MTVFTIGDSHSRFGWNMERVCNHYMGSVLCHTIARDGSRRCDLRRIKGLEDGDVVIFCFGEIDVRCHVHKHILPECSFQQVIQHLVERYLKSISEIVSSSQKKCLRVGVYNIVPPSRKSITHENIHYPYNGTDEDRKAYTLYFNERLREECKAYDFTFVDIYDHYTDKEGFLNPVLSDGSIHISDGRFLDEFLMKTFLE